MERDANQLTDAEPALGSGPGDRENADGGGDGTPVTGDPADVGQVDSASESFGKQSE